MIKSTGIFRSTDELGRVVLPINVRHPLDISDGDSLEILIDEDNAQIILQKEVFKCMRCGTTENLKTIKPGYSICSGCIDELK